MHRAASFDRGSGGGSVMELGKIIGMAIATMLGGAAIVASGAVLVLSWKLLQWSIGL